MPYMTIERAFRRSASLRAMLAEYSGSQASSLIKRELAYVEAQIASHLNPNGFKSRLDAVLARYQRGY
jgi:hypothetical protein